MGCTVCGEPATAAKGLCWMHYQRKRRYGFTGSAERRRSENGAGKERTPHVLFGNDHFGTNVSATAADDVLDDLRHYGTLRVLEKRDY